MKSLGMKKFLLLLVCSVIGIQSVASQVEENISTDNIYKIHLGVPLITQPTNMSCWITAAAMILAWRDNNDFVSPEDIVKGKGKWENYFHTGLPTSEVENGSTDQFFNKLGLTPLPKQCFTAQGLADQMKKGPIWIAVPGHALVVTGITGDGTAEGTMVYYNDPVGVSDVVSFGEFSLAMEKLALSSYKINDGTRNNINMSSEDFGKEKMDFLLAN